jgi:potassium efflux system protein
MLLIVGILASLTIYGARKLPALIDLVLRSRTSVSASARYTVSALVNYVIVGGGIVAGLSALGLQWSQLQWLVAALGVGIGFGLQEIIANFISGLIILFERPIRVGDFVSTGGSDGFVLPATRQIAAPRAGCTRTIYSR